MAQTQIQNEILNDAMEAVFNSYQYMQIDDSLTLPTKDAVELVNGGTQIGVSSSLFNKVRDGSTLFTNLVDNRAVMQFILTSGEPFTQPFNIGSIGLMKQQTAGGGLGSATNFPVSFTKDNKLVAKFRGEWKFIRIDEV